MLVLSRHKDEKLIIGLPDGRKITILVVEIRPDKVRLGIDCPLELPVHREEVWNAIDREKKEGGDRPRDTLGYPLA